MRIKRLLTLTVLVLLSVFLVAGTVSAADNWTSSATSAVTIHNLVKAEKLIPQKTGYVKLDEELDKLFSTVKDNTIAEKFDWAYHRIILDVSSNPEGYTKVSGQAYGDWAWTYPDISKDTSSAHTIPAEMANRVYHVLTEKKGISYDYAATFAVMVRYLGLESYVHTGTYKLESDDGTTALRGWTEVVLGGKRYIFDPERDEVYQKATKASWPYYAYGIAPGKQSRYTPDTAANSARDAQMCPINKLNVEAAFTGSGIGTTTGTGSYKIGSSVTVTATAGKDTNFLGWYDANGKQLSKNTSYTFKPTTSVTIYAKFFGKAVLTVKTEGAGSGTVTPSTGTYVIDTKVKVTAKADANSEFVGWYDKNGTFLSAKESYSFEIKGNTTLTAKFGKSITVTANTVGTGSVTGAGKTLSDKPVTLTAKPGDGYYMVGWFDKNGVFLTAKEELTFSPAGNTTVTAKFGVMISVNASCSGTVEGAGPCAIGENAHLVATPTAPASFKGWYKADGTLISGATELDYPVTKEETLIAMFDRDYFYDIPANAWYRTYANTAAQKNLVSGMAPFVFGGNTTLTRAMVVQMLASMSGVDTSKAPAAPFVDVPQDKWYARAINWAYEAKVVSGMDDTHFAPDTPVTREQFMVILVSYTEKQLGRAMTAGELKFTDNSDISSYATVSVQKAHAAGLISGYPDGTIKPKNELTRAEGATIMTQFSAFVSGSSKEADASDVFDVDPAYEIPAALSELPMDGSDWIAVDIIPEVPADE